MIKVSTPIHVSGFSPFELLPSRRFNTFRAACKNRDRLTKLRLSRHTLGS